MGTCCGYLQPTLKTKQEKEIENYLQKIKQDEIETQINSFKLDKKESLNEYQSVI